MFTDKEEAKIKLRKEMHDELEIMRLNARIALLETVNYDGVKDRVRAEKAEAQVVQLTADLKIAEAKVESAKYKAVAESADHIIDLEDKRMEQMKTMYEGYADKLISIVKETSKGKDVQVIVPPATDIKFK